MKKILKITLLGLSLGMLATGCGGGKEVPKKKTPNPAPLQQTTPAPQKQTAPAPQKQTAPAPQKQTAPAPQKQTAQSSASLSATAPVFNLDSLLAKLNAATDIPTAIKSYNEQLWCNEARRSIVRDARKKIAQSEEALLLKIFALQIKEYEAAGSYDALCNYILTSYHNLFFKSLPNEFSDTIRGMELSLQQVQKDALLAYLTRSATDIPQTIAVFNKHIWLVPKHVEIATEFRILNDIVELEDNLLAALLKAKVQTYVDESKFIEGREFAMFSWKDDFYPADLPEGSERIVDSIFRSFQTVRFNSIFEQINPECYEARKAEMAIRLDAFLEKNDFAGARQFLENFPLEPIYAYPLDKELDIVKKELAAIGITEEDDKEAFDAAVQLLNSYLVYLGNGQKQESIIVTLKPAYDGPDAEKYKVSLESLRHALISYSYDDGNQKPEDIIEKIDNLAQRLLEAMKTPAVTKEKKVYKYLGTAALNNLLKDLKKELCADVVAPLEFNYVVNTIKAGAEAKMAAGDFMGARDLVQRTYVDAPKDIIADLDIFRTEYTNGVVNPKHLTYARETLPKQVEAIVAQNDFNKARVFLSDACTVRILPAEIDELLQKIQAELLKLELSAEEVSKIMDDARQSIEAYFEDITIVRDIKPAGADYIPDETALNALIDDFKTRLQKYSHLDASGSAVVHVSASDCDKVASIIKQGVRPLLDAKMTPAQDEEQDVPKYLGTTLLMGRLNKLKNQIAHDKIVPEEIQFHVLAIINETNALVKANKFVEAHRFLQAYPLTGYSEIDAKIKETKSSQDLYTVTPKELKFHIDNLNSIVNKGIAVNDYLGVRDQLKEYAETGIANTDNMLNRLKEELLHKKVTPAEIKYNVALITETVQEHVDAFEFTEARNFVLAYGYRSTPEVNAAIDQTKDDLVRNVIDPAQIRFCIDEMQKIVWEKMAAGDFDGARLAVDDYPLTGIPVVDDGVANGKELTKLNVITPAQIASRVKLLRAQVSKLLQEKKFAEARRAIWNFGICDVEEVDVVVAAFKCGILNVHVNVETLRAIRADYTARMDKALASKDFVAAQKVLDDLKDIPAYSDEIDLNLDKAGMAASRLGAGAGARSVINDVKQLLYTMIAPREGNNEETDDFFESKVSWSEVEKYLELVEKKLVDYDVAKEDAKALMDDVMRNFLEAKRLEDKQGVEQEVLTTAELNEEIELFRQKLKAEMTAALAAKLALDKGASDKTATATAIRLAEEALKNAKVDGSVTLWTADIQNGVGFFQAEVERTNDKVIANILGEGARVLRLVTLDQKSVTPANATSLLVAASYAGYDELMTLALALGADVNGSSVKDPMGRNALMAAVDGGMKGHPMVVLDKTNLSAQDAMGRNVLFHAVATNNSRLVLDLLKRNVKANVADKNGMTPLMVASNAANTNLVRVLLPFSNISAANADGYTAFLFAATSGNVKTARLLQEAKCTINVTSKGGYNAVDLAARAENSDEMLAFLMDELGLNATEEKTLELIRTGNMGALTRLAKYSKATLAKEAYLLAAIEKCDKGMVRLLISRGCDINTPAVHDAFQTLKTKMETLDPIFQQDFDTLQITPEQVKNLVDLDILTPENVKKLQDAPEAIKSGYKEKIEKRKNDFRALNEILDIQGFTGE